jgi:hypothetical protein
VEFLTRNHNCLGHVLDLRDGRCFDCVTGD